MVVWTTTHCFDFFGMSSYVYCLNKCAKLQTPHGQTNILLDQLQKHFFSHITGGGVYY